jgi:hypothetical protein
MKSRLSLYISVNLAVLIGPLPIAHAIPLPDASTVSSASTALQITNTGTGKAGQFDINNAANASPALTATSNGTGYGLFSLMTGTGRGGYFQINNATNPSYALAGVSNGKGYSVYSLMTGTGRAGHFEIANSGSSNAALSGTSNGSGYSLAGFMYGTGRAGYFQISNAASVKPALEVTTNGSGSAIKAVAGGPGLSGEFVGPVSVNGFLGVGTPVPSAPLTVQTGTGYYGFIHTDGTTTVGTYVGGSQSGAFGGWIGTQSNDPLHFFTNNGQPGLTLGTDNTMKAAGNATQTRDKSGFVKAMLYVGRDGSILRCYNSTLSDDAASTVPCGCSVDHDQGSGIYTVHFGFKVDDRFISITPKNDVIGFPTFLSINMGANFASLSNDTVTVYTFYANNDQDARSDTAFMIMVY